MGVAPGLGFARGIDLGPLSSRGTTVPSTWCWVNVPKSFVNYNIAADNLRSLSQNVDGDSDYRGNASVCLTGPAKSPHRQSRPQAEEDADQLTV